MLAPFRKWIVRLLRRLVRKDSPHRLAAPVGPVGPVQGGYTSISYVPCGPYVPGYGMPGFVASGTLPIVADPHTVPGEGEDNVSSTMDLGCGYRLEFRAWARANMLPTGVTVDGTVSIRLFDAKGYVDLISEVSSSSPNSPASAVPWVASTVESRLKAMGVDVPPPDLDLLESASNKAYRDSITHVISAFASFFVSRVGHEEAAEIWQTACIRHVMTS